MLFIGDEIRLILSRNANFDGRSRCCGKDDNSVLHPLINHVNFFYRYKLKLGEIGE
jgi:hypothetical protein